MPEFALFEETVARYILGPRNHFYFLNLSELPFIVLYIVIAIFDADIKKMLENY
jgi:hypothetical protein